MSYTYTVIEEDNESWAIYESETNNFKFKFINDEHAQEHIKPVSYTHLRAHETS